VTKQIFLTIVINKKNSASQAELFIKANNEQKLGATGIEKHVKGIDRIISSYSTCWILQVRISPSGQEK
jgi:hypothetical protein